MPDMDVWRSRIQRAQEHQARYHGIWKQSLDLYSMSFFKERGSWKLDDEQISVNFATTFVKRMLQASYARSPKIFVRARRPRLSDFAEAMEEVINYQWDELELKNIVIRVFRDSLIFGIGWVECGWIKYFDEALTPEQTDPDEQLIRELTADGKTGAEQGYLNDLQKEGSFYAIRRKPWDVFYAPGFHDYYDMPYLIVREVMRREDFMRNPVYKNKKSVEAMDRTVKKGGLITSQQGRFSQNAADEDTVELFHVWDRVGMRKLTLSNADKPHMDTEWPYFAEGFPLIPLQFNDIPESDTEDNAYPFGDLEPIISQLIEKSNIRTQMAEHRRRMNSVVFVQKGSVTETEIKNYEESAALTVIPVSNTQAIVPGPELRIPRGIFETEGAVDSDLERESGLQLLLADQNSTKKVETATLASIIQSGSNLEVGFRVERLEDFSRKIAMFMGACHWQFATRKQIGEILNEFPNKMQWPELPEDLSRARLIVRKGLAWRIDAGSTRPPQDETVEREQWLRAVTVLQAASPQIYKQVERPLISQLVKKFDMKDLEKIVMDSGDRVQAQEAQAENQILAQNMPVVASVNDNHEIHIMEHKKIGNEAADAHIMQHAQLLNPEMNVGQAKAPTAEQTARLGTPAFADITGEAQNMREGTGSEFANVQ